MKTPREVLLQQHESATSRLDAIRQKVIVDLKARDREPQREPNVGFLRGFLLPLRLHLAGMSALWVVAVLLSIDTAPPASQIAENTSAPAQVFAALFENRRQLAEMINSPSADATLAPVPQPFVPRRRSALQPSFVTV